MKEANGNAAMASTVHLSSVPIRPSRTGVGRANATAAKRYTSAWKMM